MVYFMKVLDKNLVSVDLKCSVEVGKLRLKFDR